MKRKILREGIKGKKLCMEEIKVKRATIQPRVLFGFLSHVLLRIFE